MRIERLILFLLLGGLAGCVGIGGTLVWHSRFPGTSDQFAAWVQAVGSIGAILGTATVVFWQEDRRRIELRNARLKQRLDQLESLIAMSALLEEACVAFQPTPTYFTFGHCPEIFEDVQHAFAAVPVHEARSQTVARAIMTLRRESIIVRKHIEFISEKTERTTLGNPRRPRPLGLSVQRKLADIAISLDAIRNAKADLQSRFERVKEKLPVSDR